MKITLQIEVETNALEQLQKLAEGQAPVSLFFIKGKRSYSGRLIEAKAAQEEVK